MLAEESHPYSTSFVFLILPVAISFLGLGFLDSYAWFKENPNTALLLQIVGAVMVVTAGIWAAVQRHLARLMGFAVILEIGFSLIAIGLALDAEAEIYRVLFIAGLVPRGLSLGVWALSLSYLIGRINVLDLDNIRGLGKRYPLISISIILAIFSLAGMPLLASFPLKLGVIEGLSVMAPQISIWVIIGSLGMIVGGIRMLISMVSGEKAGIEDTSEPRMLRFFLVIGIVLLFIIGILPNFFIQLIIDLPAAFGPIVP